MIRLQDEPISIGVLHDAVRTDADGAVASFVGVVRNRNAGRRVVAIEYHAYPEMARVQMEKIAADAIDRHELSKVAVVHRTGRLEVGEASVAIAVSAPHRAAAMEACRYLIDTLKDTVPIWKKEFFQGGAVWIEGADRTPTD